MFRYRFIDVQRALRYARSAEHIREASLEDSGGDISATQDTSGGHQRTPIEIRMFRRAHFTRVIRPLMIPVPPLVNMPRERPDFSSDARVGTKRVLGQRPKPQCWEHGCNGRQFSTFTNLLRHQRGKSGTAAKSYCPKCGAEFSRTTARNAHLGNNMCTKQKVPSQPESIETYVQGEARGIAARTAGAFNTSDILPVH